MITAIDTNVLVALWDRDDALNSIAQTALDSSMAHGKLVISVVVFAELLAFPRRTEAFIDRFLGETGISVEWALSESIWRTAGRAFQTYAKRRHRQSSAGPRRLLADFLIGAHAYENNYKLLTMDEGVYRAAFPKLVIVRI
jgi:predicted nucleic acid-binding protein